MRQIARVDKNQAEIVQALRQAGATVLLLHQVGAGCPDILVGHRGQNTLVEIKAPRGSLTLDEAKFIDGWRGQVAVVRSVAEALRLIGGEVQG